jgi:DNA-binding SARP family transcriptional activator
MLRVSLLGEQVIVDEATGAVRSGSSRTVELIAFLVVHVGAPQSRQRIAGLFWPEFSGGAGADQSAARAAPAAPGPRGRASLVVTSRDLTWHDTLKCRVDVREFALQRAAALASDVDEIVVVNAASALDRYRCEFLPGRHDEWILDVREELERQCGELCDLLSSTRARIGDLAGAIEVARRRVQLRPLEEVGYRTLMELQAELGDRAGAVSTFHRCASVLERELGVDPDPATRQSVQRLLARNHDDVEPSERRAGLSGANLIGRAHELELLESVWREAAAAPRLVLVCGDAGVGKTRLVAELAELARARGTVVASTRCFGAAGDWLWRRSRIGYVTPQSRLRRRGLPPQTGSPRYPWAPTYGRSASGRSSTVQ